MQSKTQTIELPADSIRRMLWSIRKLGEAYRAGAIRVDEDAGFGLAVEARTILGEWDKADSRIMNLTEPDRDREEDQ